MKIRSEKKTGVAAKVAPDLLKSLKAMADVDRRTLSFTIEEAIREYVDKHAPKASRRPDRK